MSSSSSSSSTTPSTLEEVTGFDFVAQEEEVLRLWEEIDAFHTSLKKSEGRPAFVFNDGPPFATGLPHFGHILAGTIKDIVTRYAHQTGHYVERRFGWDCHGLPVEFEIDKQHGINSREQVLEMGIGNYNDLCRGIVQRYSKEWETTVTRLGRWIDFKDDYKTMYPEFMESVWWVFKTMFDKGLVYRGFKVMPYSTACTTPLSNFEANQNYKDISDPSVIVSFPVLKTTKDSIQGASLVAWTTTPWTLPSNLALCVHPELTYVVVLDKPSGNKYVLMEARISELYKPKKKKKNKKKKDGDAAADADELDYEILDSFTGAELEGTEYEPLFLYFEDYPTSKWKVVTDTYVTADSGTGIVHQAPAFGEDDYRVCLKNGVIEKGADLPLPVDADGRFTEPVTDYVGMHVKELETNKLITEQIKANGKLVSKSTFKHSYPFCWRSDTPLIYRAIPSWFVKVESLTDKLLANNEQSYWVPQFAQENRFANWLANARDWAISRNRFWGTPIPLWVSDDMEEVVCVGSIAELEELSGVKLDDLHREFVDPITIPSKMGKGDLRRVDEVFDCWFESGSMPYASKHYPFENKEKFDETFPADFIAEGLDQTRGWFYTLLVISTALFDKPAFKNLIVNGLVLAEDGKKMSKRLKNYPPPTYILDKYGADALRLYLINSPVVRAEPLRFAESGVQGVIRDIFLPWCNGYRFFVQNARMLEHDGLETFSPDFDVAKKTTNQFDLWILSSLNTLIEFTHQEMQAYRLYTVVPRLVNFLEDLTNWYVRFNRLRLKGVDNTEEDRRHALSTLFLVLLDMCKLMAPLTPFLTETMYQNLRLVLPEELREDSVHYCMLPESSNQSNPDIERSMKVMQDVVITTRKMRDRKTLPLKMPLRSLLFVHTDQQVLDDLLAWKQYVLEELNVFELETSVDEEQYCTLRAEPNRKALGGRLKTQMKQAMDVIRDLTVDQLRLYEASNTITVGEFTFIEGDLEVQRKANVSESKYEALAAASGVAILDCEIDEELKELGAAREILTNANQLRKTAGLVREDVAEIYYKLNNIQSESALINAFKNQQEYIQHHLGRKLLPYNLAPESANVIARDEVTTSLVKGKVELILTHPQYIVPSDAFGDEKVSNQVNLALATLNYDQVTADLATHDNKMSLFIEMGKRECVLTLGQNLFASVYDMIEGQ